MYEKKQGAERLIYALYNRKEDIETVARMAVTLDYIPSQLHEDIQALHDYLVADESERELIDVLLEHVRDLTILYTGAKDGDDPTPDNLSLSGRIAQLDDLRRYLEKLQHNKKGGCNNGSEEDI